MSSVFADVDQRQVPATTGQRFVNFLFDTILCGTITAIILFFLLGMILIGLGMDVDAFVAYEDSLQMRLLDYVMRAVAIILLYTLVEGASKGRSLGKLVTGTVAVREDGQPFTFRDAFMRALCRIIPFEPLSGLGYPWHDRITKTTVVKKHSVGFSNYEASSFEQTA